MANIITTPADIAIKYLGETEIPNNMGFTDKQFEKKMVDVGFQKGFAWCALFMELCYSEGAPDFYAKYKKLFSASALTTYLNFKTAGQVSDIPKIGCGVIWQHGHTPLGHAGIVVDIKGGDVIWTVEGNTNNDGSREGYEVAKKTNRRLNAPFNEKGLNLRGFINF